MGFIFSAFAIGILACQLVAALPPCGVPSMAGLALLALLAGLGLRVGAGRAGRAAGVAMLLMAAVAGG